MEGSGGQNRGGQLQGSAVEGSTVEAAPRGQLEGSAVSRGGQSRGGQLEDSAMEASTVEAAPRGQLEGSTVEASAEGSGGPWRAARWAVESSWKGSDVEGSDQLLHRLQELFGYIQLHPGGMRKGNGDGGHGAPG